MFHQCYASGKEESVSRMLSLITDNDGLQRHSSLKALRALLSTIQVSSDASGASNGFEAPRYAPMEMAKILERAGLGRCSPSRS